MGSLYLHRLSQPEQIVLRKRLHAVQQAKCFICEEAIDLQLHATSIDVDHIEPSAHGGRDDEANFALTHSSCNRSKQASDLRVARVLHRFEKIAEREAAQGGNTGGANLGHVLKDSGGAAHDLSVTRQGDQLRMSFPEIGDNAIKGLPVHKDELSSMEYVLAVLPIQYFHHDDQINPRGIGRALRGLVEEFFRKNPQLHIGLGWMDLPADGDTPKARLRIFDGQHKIAAQVLLGVRHIPVRIFLNPDRDRLLNANTNAGTTLRQVAFDKSVQRRLGNTILLNRIERFRVETNRNEDDWTFSEDLLVKHFRGEANAVRRYVLDGVRNSITHSEENRLRDYIEFSGKGGDKPFSYSSIEKTFFSFFIHPQMLTTSWEWRIESDTNPRENEKRQIVRLMNLICELVYDAGFDSTIGTDRIENKVQKGNVDIPDAHLRAFRMAKEEVLHAWLDLTKKVVRNYFAMTGKNTNDDKLFQSVFPEELWNTLRRFIMNLSKLPLWIDRPMAATVFGGKQSPNVWATIFETGRSPQGQQVLVAPINLIEMVK
jgi:hypothetical protein